MKKDLKGEKLKIGFFIPYFIPAWRFGGSVKGTYEIAKKLVEKGHSVNIYCTDLSNKHKNRNDKRTDNIDGINIFYFRNLSNRLSSKYNIHLPFEMRKILLDELKKLDIIHIQEIYSIMTYWIYKRIKKINKPLFISTRGALSPYPQKSKKFLKKVVNLILKRPLKKADLVFAQTLEEKKDCLDFGLKNVKILNNGIEIQNFKNLPSRSIFRNKYGINDDDLLILFLGRINEIKGLRYLVGSFSYLKNFPKIKLLIIGPDDNYLSKLIELIKKLNLNEKIIIINGLYGQEKIEALSASDIFCLPSIYDCCPNSMLEACAAGLPIITTKTNGLNDITLKGAGICVKSRDSDALKKAILNLTRTKNKMIEMGKIGRSIVEKEYDWNNIIEILEDHYYLSLKSIDNRDREKK